MSSLTTNLSLATQSRLIIKTSRDHKVVKTRVTGNTARQMQMSMLLACCCYRQPLDSPIWTEYKKVVAPLQATSSQHTKVLIYSHLANWDLVGCKYKHNNQQARFLKQIWETKHSTTYRKKAILHKGSFLQQTKWSLNLKIWMEAIVRAKTLLNVWVRVADLT